MKNTLTPALEIHDLTVTYDKKPVLWGIDLQVKEASLAGIIGPNGAGKSTLIKAAMGLIPTASGYCHFFEKKLNEVRQRVAYVPQRSSVDWDFPISVRETVMMGRYGKLGLFKRPGKADRETAEECLRKTGMESFADRQISKLSGGQQQRVFLARALAQDADLYFMDEPFTGVDAATEASIVELLQQMRNMGKTIIVVHHDLQTAEKYFDHLILLNMRLVASGAVQDVFTPKLLQDTYGGRLNLLSKMAGMIAENDFPVQEQH